MWKNIKAFIAGRYETGNLSGTIAKVQKGQTDISNQNWYTMYKLGKEMYDSNPAIQSSMIWGCQWDQVMIWMKDVQNINNPSKYYITDSTNMGNYTGIKLPTGSNNSYKVKNIYDMAGNVFDFTLEAYSTDCRVLHRWFLRRSGWLSRHQSLLRPSDNQLCSLWIQSSALCNTVILSRDILRN